MNEYMNLLINSVRGHAIRPNRSYSRSRANNSVYIALGAYEGRERLRFSFGDGAFKMISDTSRILPFIHKKRLYLIKVDEGGFRINGKKKGFFTIPITSEDRAYLKEFVGEYELKYDDLAEEFYVEKETE